MRRLHRWFILSLVAVHFPGIAAAQNGPAEPPREPQTPAAAQGRAPTALPGEAPIGAEPSPGEGASSGATLSPLLGASHAEQRIEELERRLRLLEDKHTEAHDAVGEVKGDKKGDKGTLPGVALAYGPNGVGIVSADGKFQLRFRPVLQTDARFFLATGTNTFLLRRARLAMEGTVFEFFDWRIMSELAGTPRVRDAFVNISLFKEIQLRTGKFKPAVGLERLLSDIDLPFLERGLPTNLVPDRDIGVQLHGDILGGTVVYAAGYFNGTGDGINGDNDNNDNNDKKDIIGRIVVRPFQPTFIAPLRKLGLGMAFTRGTHVGALPPYRTPVQTTFFQYVDGVTAGGTHRRLAPQAFLYAGPLGVFGEYTRSTQIVIAPGISTRLNHASWQIVGSFFVTGEEASPGTVTPKHNLDPRSLGFGAVELVARYGELEIDEDTFRLRMADPTKSARKAVEWGVGANWHLARNFKFMINYEHTSFDGGSPSGDRQSESLILSRLQAAY